ncbi:hypothetical protein CXB37_09635 [Pseudomonas syringae pv. syringae]|nr:hypothetical protein CXB37_09635 [Pseudomonas syringae pv. syringae]
MVPRSFLWRTSETLFTFVGANLFAKALVRAIHLQRMYRPFREQCGSPPRSLLLDLWCVGPFVSKLASTVMHSNQLAIISPSPPSALALRPGLASSGGTWIRPAAAVRGRCPG